MIGPLWFFQNYQHGSASTGCSVGNSRVTRIWRIRILTRRSPRSARSGLRSVDHAAPVVRHHAVVRHSSRCKARIHHAIGASRETVSNASVDGSLVRTAVAKLISIQLPIVVSVPTVAAVVSVAVVSVAVVSRWHAIDKRPPLAPL